MGRLKSNIIGDTIVEVMIVLAVLSVGLTLGYSIASRSILVGQAALERNQATQLLESELQELKYLVTSNSSNINSLAINTNFCIQ